MPQRYEQVGTDRLHFDRLLKGGQLTYKDRANEIGVPEAWVVNEYIPNYEKQTRGKPENDAAIENGWTRLVEYSLLEISQLLSRVEVERIQAALMSDDPVVSGDMFAKVQEWAKEHPELANTHPIIQFLAVTPPTLGYVTQLIRKHGYKIKEKYGKEDYDQQIKEKVLVDFKRIKGPLGKELRTRFESGLYLTAAENMAVALGDGSIPRLDAVAEQYHSLVTNKSYNGRGVPSPTTTSDIKAVLLLVKAAIGVRGARWKGEAPEILRSLTKEYVELEWILENPVLAEADLPLLKAVVRQQGNLESIAFTQDNGKKILSWPLLLHKLYFESTRLQKQWAELRLRPNSFLLEEGIWDDPVIVPQLTQLGTVVAEVLGEEIVGDAVQYLRGVIAKADHEGGVGGDERRWGVNRLLVEVDLFEHAKIDPEEVAKVRQHGGSVPDAEVIKKLGEAMQDWYWRAMLAPLRTAIEKATIGADSQERMAKLSAGYFKNLFEFLALENAGTATEAQMIEAMGRMRAELGEGAEVNRAQDIMNTYVKSQYHKGTAADQEWRIQYLVDQGIIDPADLPWPFGKTLPFVDFELVHRQRKQAYQTQAESYSATRDLQVFSDTIQRDETTEKTVDALYKPKLMVKVLNPQIEATARLIQAGTDVGSRLDELKAQVLTLSPEKNQLRDYFLENIAHLELWLLLQQTSKTAQFAAEGIRLDMTTIDLEQHLGTNDQGVLVEAYMKTYPVVRVKGLGRALFVFSVQEKKQIADFLTERTPGFTPATAELFERLAVDLEIDHLREDYTATRERITPVGSNPSSEDRLAAADHAFGEVLAHVVERFPRATYHRDSILFALMTDLATTLPHIQRLERLTYAYASRHPGEEQKGKETPFTVTETVKNYLSLFQDRAMRRKVLTWFFGGEIPDDRFLEGTTFKVNEQEKVEAFWALSEEERRAIFYSALLGQHGLFEIPSVDMGQHVMWHDMEDLISSIPASRVGEGHREFFAFLRDFYKLNFEKIFPDKKKGKAFKMAFFEVFARYRPARRVELFLAISERMRDLKRSQTELTPGEAIRLLLEQGGVVMVKAGQVMSEQKDLLPPDVRSDLSSLKDRANPYNKRGVFTYAQQARLFEVVEGQPQLSEIGELEGSASIKQVHKATTVEGEELALKAERPSIDKNYAEDLEVLEHVVNRFILEGYHVPSWIVSEIKQVVEAEMDFGREARNAETLRTNFVGRGATINLDGKEVPMSTPKVKLVITKSGTRRRMQIMLEEFAKGISISDIIRLQELDRKPAMDEKSIKDKERLMRKLRRLSPDLQAELWTRYAKVDVEGVQAGMAIDLLFQIAEDGTFHSDMHGGNVMVSALPDHEGVSLIDAGSAGESKEKERFGEAVDARTDFLDFGVNLLLLKAGFGDVNRVAEVICKYTNTADPKYWQSEVQKALDKSETVGEVFKEVLAEVLRVTEGKLDMDFRYLLKALASAGGHLEALRNKITGHILKAFMQLDQPAGALPPQMVLMQAPEIQKLLPLLPRMPTIAAMLGALAPS